MKNLTSYLKRAGLGLVVLIAILWMGVALVHLAEVYVGEATFEWFTWLAIVVWAMVALGIFGWVCWVLGVLFLGDD